MTFELRVPCPTCSGSRSTTTGDRHADTNMDVCATCHDEGTILARPGETPEASFGFVNRNTTATDGKDFPKTGMSFPEFGNGARTALVSKIAEARRYADREGFEHSTLCLPREDTDALLAALSAALLERVRHVKRGTEYEVLGEAEMQVSTVPPEQALVFGDDDGHPRIRLIGDSDKLTVYRGGDGKLWCRFPDEMRDGRFVPAAAPAADGGRVR